MAANASQKLAFIHKVWTNIAGLDLQGLFPSVLIAQAALESGWGQSELATKYNNLFGVKKGSSWTGRTVNLPTREVINGVSQTVRADFRVYPSWMASIADRNKLLLTLKRYANVRSAATPQAQIEALKAAGYATGENYVSSLMNTINANSLTRYDELKKKIMNNKTLSTIMIVAGAIISAIGIYNVANLSKYLK